MKIFGFLKGKGKEGVESLNKLNSLVLERNKHIEVLFERIYVLRRILENDDADPKESAYLLPQSLIDNVEKSNKVLASYVGDRTDLLKNYLEKNNEHQDEDYKKIENNVRLLSSKFVKLNNLTGDTTTLFNFLRAFMNNITINDRINALVAFINYCPGENMDEIKKNLKPIKDKLLL